MNNLEAQLFLQHQFNHWSSTELEDLDKALTQVLQLSRNQRKKLWQAIPYMPYPSDKEPPIQPHKA